MSTAETLPSVAGRERLIVQLKDANYRKAFVEAHAKDSIAFQLRMMRKAKGWDQEQLAQHALGDPKLQSMISRYENPDYGKYSLNTLLELAAAFDVALVVHFAPFSELLDWDATPVEQKIIPKPFQEELTGSLLLRSSKRRKPHKVELKQNHASRRRRLLRKSPSDSSFAPSVGRALLRARTKP